MSFSANGEELMKRRERLQVVLEEQTAKMAEAASGSREFKRCEHEVKQTRALITAVDAALRLCGEVVKSKAKRREKEPVDVTSSAVARIGKTARAELRVQVAEIGGRQTVDVRTWFVPKGSTEWVPSRKGVQIDASKLPLLIDALRMAAQHLPQG